MKQKFLFLILGLILALPGLAQDFQYTYKGQTLLYTILDEDAKTCETTAWMNDDISGALSIPQIAKDGDVGYTVISIGAFSFDGNGITSIEIPNSVTEIGYASFAHCSNLRKVQLSNSLTQIVECFKECTSLEELQLGNSLTKIGSNCFTECSSIKELNIPNSVTELEGCFTKCISLEKLQLGNSLTKIGWNCFTECSSIKELNIPNSVTEIGDYSFQKCTGLEKLQLGNSLTTIGHYAFDDCQNLTAVSIPGTVTGDVYAFNGCPNLTLTIENFDGIKRVNMSDIKNLIAYSYDPKSHILGNSVYQLQSTLYVPVGSITYCANKGVGFTHYQWWDPTGPRPQYVEPENLPTGIYFGMLSFNDRLEGVPMDPISLENKDRYKDFVNNMSTDFATLLYYGVDESLNALQYRNYPKDLGNIILVTFTDGLDQGSLAMNTRYNNSKDYANALSRRISDIRVNDRRLKAYTIGLESEDAMSDPELFRNNLESLSSNKQNAISAANMTEVQTKLNDICEKIVTEQTQRTLRITVPMLSNGDKYRFTMDRTTADANTSKLYFEGNFSSNDNKLTNVRLEGFTCDYEDAINSEQDGIYITFTLRDCRTPDGRMLDIESDDINQWQYSSSSSKWVHNRENIRDAKIEDVRISTAIILALDASSSLGDKFGKVKEMANSFIDRLAQSAGSGVEEIEADMPDTDAPVEYYNLQGLKVSDPAHGIFIRRQGPHTRKVLLP